MSFTSFLSKLFGNKSQRDLKEIMPIVDKIKALGPDMERLSNDELRDIITKVRQSIADSISSFEESNKELRIKVEELPFDERQPIWDEIDNNEKKILDIIEDQLNEHLPTVFAAVKETAARFAKNETVEVTATQLDRDLAAEGRDFVSIEGDKAIWKNHWIAGGNEIKWDMIHYDVQLIGGIVLHQGKIAEMATGEGKTLVATLPVFLRSLSKRGVHVVTVNDYLSKRDSEWMGPLYMFHGSTVDCIDKHEPNSDERRDAYNCDINYDKTWTFVIRRKIKTEFDINKKPHINSFGRSVFDYYEYVCLDIDKTGEMSFSVFSDKDKNIGDIQRKIIYNFERFYHSEKSIKNAVRNRTAFF